MTKLKMIMAAAAATTALGGSPAAAEGINLNLNLRIDLGGGNSLRLQNEGLSAHVNSFFANGGNDRRDCLSAAADGLQARNQARINNGQGARASGEPQYRADMAACRQLKR